MSPTKPPSKAPGLAVEVVAPPPGDRTPLRTDIAGFIGRTRRGPVGQRKRVEGLSGYQPIFGDVARNAFTSYAVQGYFANEGQVAHIVRLAGSGVATASALWDFDDPQSSGPHDKETFGHSKYTISASSPGAWANGAQVIFRYRRQGVTGNPAVDVIIKAEPESTEYLRGIDPKYFEDQVNSLSVLIRVTHVEGAVRVRGSSRFTVEKTLALSGGADGDPPTKESYLDALTILNDEPEVALIVLPDLFHMPKDDRDLRTNQDQLDILTDQDRLDLTDQDRLDILTAAIGQAEALHDRLVLVDLPPTLNSTPEILAWIERWKKTLKDASAGLSARAAAVYHPWFWVEDPLGSTPDDARTLLPPSGYVAGVISRLDRQRGAQHTPANEPVLEVFDVSQSFRESERAVLNEAGVNLVKCFPGQGLLVWGGRTLGTEPGSVFVAHRRLVHRLVRAIRRVAEPLVFDVNGPELWLAVVRAITTVLLEAYRAGGLQGARPEEGFFVKCDSGTNPPEANDEGRVVCEIGIAPAVPMEFILLRVALSAEGRLEVFG